MALGAPNSASYQVLSHIAQHFDSRDFQSRVCNSVGLRFTQKYFAFLQYYDYYEKTDGCSSKSDPLAIVLYVVRVAVASYLNDKIIRLVFYLRTERVLILD